MQPRKALGKGLASLIPSAIEIPSDKQEASLKMVDANSIVPNRLQPRHEFSEESLKELADSIRQKGILQPLVVVPAVNGRYELIAGERRLRASRMAGLDKVPVVVKSADPESMLEMALIENLQREDLNPIDEAKAYNELIETFDFTQEDVADKVSRSRSHVANTLRLLFLPKVIQEDVILGRLSSGHARALLSVSDLQEQLRIRELILHSGLTVRDVEKLIQQELSDSGKKEKIKKKRAELPAQLRAVVEEITKQLGTKVKIVQHSNKKSGQIIIEYYSVQDLNRIYRSVVSN